MPRLFYQPETGVSADYIPFYENGIYYLFYLRDFRDPEGCGEGTPWYLVTTEDFVHFTEHDEVLPRGTVEDQDLYVFTGSVTRMGDGYHIYYTGHNPHLRQHGKPEQAVMHAVSADLLHWTKCPEDTFFAPADGYEPHDWRDPFLWYDEQTRLWWMLLAARKQTGASRYRGLTALCSSPDGRTWQVEKPLWEPDSYFAHECPDLFKMGDWFYLIFSEFSQDKVTRYRMSRSPLGPWTAPPDDRFDTAAYYAAKSIGNGSERYLFGWLATREGDSDSGIWQWGGCLVTHQLLQCPDGTLRVKLPETVRQSLPAGTPLSFRQDGATALDCHELGLMQESGAISCTFRTDSQTGRFSVALAADEYLAEGYFLRLELDRRRLVLDRWPRTPEPGMEPGMERPIRLARDGVYRLTILIDGTAGCAYLNDEVALCFRMYELSRPHWGTLAENGVADVAASAGWTA